MVFFQDDKREVEPAYKLDQHNRRFRFSSFRCRDNDKIIRFNPLAELILPGFNAKGKPVTGTCNH